MQTIKMASSVVGVQSLESCSIKDRRDSMAFSCLLRLFFSFFSGWTKPLWCKKATCECLFCGETVAVMFNDQFINEISSRNRFRRAASLIFSKAPADRMNHDLLLYLCALSKNSFAKQISVTNLPTTDNSAEYSSHFKSSRNQEESHRLQHCV